MKKVVNGMDKLGKDFYEDLFYDKDELMKTVSFDEGVKEGKEEGMKEGENKKAIETAKRLLSENFDTQFINKIIDLPSEEIEKLR